MRDRLRCSVHMNRIASNGLVRSGRYVARNTTGAIATASRERADARPQQHRDRDDGEHARRLRRRRAAERDAEQHHLPAHRPARGCAAPATAQRSRRPRRTCRADRGDRPAGRATGAAARPTARTSSSAAGSPATRRAISASAMPVTQGGGHRGQARRRGREAEDVLGDAHQELAERRVLEVHGRAAADRAVAGIRVGPLVPVPGRDAEPPEIGERGERARGGPGLAHRPVG